MVNSPIYPAQNDESQERQRLVRDAAYEQLREMSEGHATPPAKSAAPKARGQSRTIYRALGSFKLRTNVVASIKIEIDPREGGTNPSPIRQQSVSLLRLKEVEVRTMLLHNLKKLHNHL